MRAWFTFRRLVMLAGFLAAGTGDWFLVVRKASRASPDFLWGVLCFSLAQVLWMAAQAREARPDARISVALGVPLALFASVRLMPVLPFAAGVAVWAYSILTAVSFSVAYGTRRLFYAWGIGLLLFSDLMIGGALLRAPGCGSVSGPVYLLAEACLLVSFFAPREARFDPSRHDAWPPAVLFGTAAFTAFLLAAVSFPGAGYNPLMRMLSALGRTVVRGIAFPLCHYLFMAGLLLATLATAHVWGRLVRRGAGERRAALLEWGAALNVAGLGAIMLVPENVNMTFHNAGCHLAAFGGAGALFARDRPGRDRVWTCVLLGVVSFFGLCLLLHGAGVVPFAPWVTATQKVLIVSFALWTGDLAWRHRMAPLRRWHKLTATFLVAVMAVGLSSQMRSSAGAKAQIPCASAPLGEKPRPLDADERAALRWLERVTGPLSPAEEKEWWNVGGKQHGLLAKRYHIAFCGYAAAALGLRGDPDARKVAGRILGNCIERYLARDVWAYSMSKNYWGLKPWAPDPCYRENVMYTGHLLQLLALYETFTGDTRYWKEGFDFVWDKKKRVHYDVQKLIDVTVWQMRNGPNGGVTCEPNLMFFPCNNHPHVALALFARLGHGSWAKDARRWEKWALENYMGPLFGGGALNIVYEVRSGIFYPRGHNGLDGWSLLWYEPWAADRGTALALWKKAAERIDWEQLSTGPDARKGGFSCCDPADVPPVASLSFLAAAARACDDPATADRLEAILAPRLVRRNGEVYLDVGREWRVGSTANWIISRAEANGARFRDLVVSGPSAR